MKQKTVVILLFLSIAGNLLQFSVAQQDQKKAHVLFQHSFINYFSTLNDYKESLKGFTLDKTSTGELLASQKSLSNLKHQLNFLSHTKQEKRLANQMFNLTNALGELNLSLDHHSSEALAQVYHQLEILVKEQNHLSMLRLKEKSSVQEELKALEPIIQDTIEQIEIAHSTRNE